MYMGSLLVECEDAHGLQVLLEFGETGQACKNTTGSDQAGAQTDPSPGVAVLLGRAPCPNL